MANSGKPRICIVGSGPGGGIAALELARSCSVTVIVVDTDQIATPYSQAEEKKLQELNLGFPFNQEVIRAFGYGGSSNLWHGVFTKMDEEDWRFIDLAAGEEISRKIISLYGELKYAFGELPREAYSRSPSKSLGNDLYRELELSGKFRSKDFFIQKRPFRTRDELRRLKEICQDIVFVENATALYLVGSRDNPSQATALVVNVNGQKRTIESDYFILAAGALESPRIVLQGNEEGYFPIVNDNIGRYLFDHPWTVVGEIVSKQGLFRLGLSDVYSSPGLRYRIGYRLQESIDKPQIGTNHCIAFKPLFFGDFALFKEALKAIISLKPSIMSIFRLLVRFKISDIFASLFLLVCEKFGLGVFIRRSLVFCYLEQPVRSESSVSLTNRHDSLGRRIPAINWVVGNEEAEGIALVQSTLSGALSSSDRFSFSPYDNPSGALASGAHHAGTMRIGQNEQNGVIDKDLKIFGTMNVFVCDSSIFPNYGNSNPTLTLAAFSLRLARHLLSLLSGGRLID